MRYITKFIMNESNIDHITEKLRKVCFTLLIFHASLLSTSCSDNSSANNELFEAVTWCNNLTKVRLLIEKGANVNARDSDNSTPLHKAAWHGCPDIVEALLAAGADIDAQRTDGFTPLHLAVYRVGMVDGLAKGGIRHIQIAKQLLDAGADPHKQNNDGHSPIAFVGGSYKLQKLFRKKEESQGKSNQGKTSLAAQKYKTGQSYVTLDQLMSGLSSMFSMKERNPHKGQRNYAGSSTYGTMASLQILGEEMAISEASLTIFLKSSAHKPEIDFLALNIFAENIAPKWDGREKWIKDNMTELIQIGYGSRSKNLSDRRIEMKWYGPGGSLELKLIKK